MITDPVHRDRLNALADFLRELPAEQLYMSRWLKRGFAVDATWSDVQIGHADQTMCDTAACAAGWATAVFPGELLLRTCDGPIPYVITRPGYELESQFRPLWHLEEFFGLDVEEVSFLFIPEWYYDIDDIRDCSREIEPADVVDRIEALLAGDADDRIEAARVFNDRED